MGAGYENWNQGTTDADAGRNREAIEALKRENDRLKVATPRSVPEGPAGWIASGLIPRCWGVNDGEVVSHISGDSDLGVVRRSDDLDRSRVFSSGRVSST